MKNFSLKKCLLAATALLCLGAARADVIDFENLDFTYAPFVPLLSGNDYLIQGNYFVQLIEAHNPDGGGMAGSLVNGALPESCLDGVCPSGNASNYLASANDAIVHFGMLQNGATSTLSSFDAAFLAPTGVTLSSGTVAYLAIEADRADGSYALGVFALGGPGGDGSTAFSTFQAANAQMIDGTGTLTSGQVTDLYAYAYYCGPTDCSAFDSNKGQFALDNIAINVTAVPEPSQYALLALGLVAVGVIKRRRPA